jgi:hypothetical protein
MTSELNSSDIVQARQKIQAGERPILILIRKRLEMIDLQARIDALTTQLEQANRNRANMEENPNHPLRDFTAPKDDEIQLGYTAPSILAEEYQIPPGWINAVQRILFHGLSHEDATHHLANFDELCSMLKIRMITQEDLKGMTFTFSLADKAKN